MPGPLFAALANPEQSRAAIQALLETESAGVVLVTPDGTISLGNASMIGVPGFAPELVGGPLNPLLDAFARASTQEDASRALLDQLREATLPLPCGGSLFEMAGRGSRVFKVSSYQLSLPQGTELGRLWSFRDVSDFAKAGRALRTTQEQLAEATKWASLGLLLAGTAHEINTPVGALASARSTLERALQGMFSHLQDLEQAAGGDCKLSRFTRAVTESSRLIGDAADRIAVLVQQIKGFASNENSVLARANLAKVLDDTLALVNHQLRHRVVITKKYESVPELECYPGRLSQVFINLMINAAQAIAERGEICVTLQQSARGVEVAISDTGCGICADNLNQIFRCGYSTKKAAGGTGLGLAICREIIEAHHGELNVKSEVGKGTTFTVLLPTNLGYLLANPGPTAQA